MSPPSSTASAPAHAPAEPVLLRGDADGVATFTLNRPAARNALSSDLLAALQDELDTVREERDVKVVVLAGSGPGFCAGHDLKEVRAHPDRAFYQALFEQCSRVMLAITHLPKPVIARVHGTASAAGCQLVASCDLAVASSEARFATPGVNIGLFCSTPMVALSRAVGRKQTMEMLLTGDLIPAQKALEIGLVNRVVGADELDDEVYGLARQIASKSPLTLAIGKEAFYRPLEMGLAEAYAYTSRVAADNMMARDAAEGIDAFIEKREPTWRGE